MQSRNLYCVQLQSKLVTVHTRYARSLLLCPPHFADGVAQRGDYSDAEAWSPPPPWVASVALSIDVPGGGRTAPWSVPLLNVDHIIVTDGLGNERVLRDGEAVQLSPSFVLSIQFEVSADGQQARVRAPLPLDSLVPLVTVGAHRSTRASELLHRPRAVPAGRGAAPCRLRARAASERRGASPGDEHAIERGGAASLAHHPRSRRRRRPAPRGGGGRYGAGASRAGRARL